MKHLLHLRSRTQEGFGLIELIVVIAIVGVLTLVAVPVYGAVQYNAEKVHAQKVTSELYTSVVSIYKSEGIQKAADYVYQINQQYPTLVFKASDNPPPQKDPFFTKYPFFGGPRYTWSSVAVKSPDVIGQYSTLYRANKNNLDPKNRFPAERGDGTNICVVAFWTDGKGNSLETLGQEKFKGLLFAGPGCGDTDYSDELFAEINAYTENTK